jgi:hypothetical protein
VDRGEPDACWSNLWVRELTANLDIHTTFSAINPLHVTARVNPWAPTCQGNTTLGGTWPNPPAAAALVIAAGQPAAVCNVNVQTSHLPRLNAVAHQPVNGTFCRAGFLAAQAAGRLTPAVAGAYDRPADLIKKNARRRHLT